MSAEDGSALEALGIRITESDLGGEGLGTAPEPSTAEPGAGHELRRTVLELDLRGLPFEVRRLSLERENLGDGEVLTINDGRRFAGPFATVPSPVGAVTVGLEPAGAAGGRQRLELEGPVERLSVGGEHLVLHRLCLEGGD